MPATCYCGLNKTFEHCCEPIILGVRAANTPEALMRSRYSAFCTRNIDFLESSTQPKLRPAFDRAANLTWASRAKFIRLEILKSSQSGTTGFVSFKAFYNINFKPQIHQEDAEFVNEKGIWYFCQGS